MGTTGALEEGKIRIVIIPRICFPPSGLTGYTFGHGFKFNQRRVPICFAIEFEFDR